MFSLTFNHSEVFDVVQWHNSGTTQCKNQSSSTKVVVLIKSTTNQSSSTKLRVVLLFFVVLSPEWSDTWSTTTTKENTIMLCFLVVKSYSQSQPPLKWKWISSQVLIWVSQRYVFGLMLIASPNRSDVWQRNFNINPPYKSQNLAILD